MHRNGTDFVCTNGTIIYKDAMNEAALVQLLADFSELMETHSLSSTVQEIRKNTYGNYVVIIFYNGLLYGFVDESASYPFYYHYSGQNYVFSNTFYNVNECARQEVNQKALLEYGLCAFIVGRDTPFCNVYRVTNDECFVISPKGGSVVFEKVELNDYGLNTDDNEQIYADLKITLERIGEVRSKFVNNAVLFTTGGMDSRLGLALHGLTKDPVKLAMWNGEDIITNGTDQDIKISKQLAELIDCEYVLCDVSMDFSECLESLNAEELSKYGEYACIYSHNKPWLTLPDRACFKNADWLENSAAPQMLRTVSYIEDNWYEGFNAYDLVKDVFMRSGIIPHVFSDKGFFEYVEASVKESHNCGGSLDMRMCDMIFSYNNFLHASELVGAYWNLYCYNFSPCAEKRVYDLVEELDYSYRANNKVSLQLMKDWNESFLQIPFFTHHHTMIYDPKSGSAYETQGHQFIYSIRNRLKGTIFFKPLNTLGHIVKSKLNRRTSDSGHILGICLDVLGNSDRFKSDTVALHNPRTDTGFDLPGLARLVAVVRMADLFYK